MTRRSIPIVSTKSFIKMASLHEQSRALLTLSLLSNIKKGYGRITLYLCPFFPLFNLHEEQATSQAKPTGGFSSSESDSEQVTGEENYEDEA